MTVVVTHADMMACNYCNRGARAFCARHEINWQVFIQQGIPVSDVEHIDDAMLKNVIQYALNRAQGAQ